MSILKRTLALVCSLALLATMGVAITGCSESGVAATWANGKVMEEDVTSTIEQIRTTYGYSSDETSWESFIKERTYDTTSTTKEKKAAGDGTVADLRSYYVTQQAREDVAKWQAQQDGLTVSDDELNSAVEQAKTSVEKQYMEGTFESILQLQGYDDLDDYKAQLKENLQVEKLQQQICGSTDQDSSFDQDKWDSYVDGLMGYADLKINDMPSGLSYDPATINASSSSSSSSSSTTDTSSTSSSDSSSSSSSSSN